MSLPLEFKKHQILATGKSKLDKALNPVESFLIGGVAAGISKTLAAPIERVKLLIQTQDANPKIISGEVKRYTGIGNCFTRIASEQGIGAFWRGNGVNIIRYFPTQALNFSFKGSVKKLDALKKDKTDSYLTSTAKNIAAGGIAGTGSLAFVYSLDYARTRLANDLKGTKAGSEREFNGLFDVYKKTVAADGIAGLYRGFVISAVGIFVYRGLYFGLYDSIMPLFPQDSVNLATRFAVGYCVTVAAGLASYPIDTIRRRMMMTSGAGAELQYKSSLDCGAQIVKKEGVKSLFKGAGANILRGVAGAGVLAGFDSVSDAYVNYAYGANAYIKH